MDKAKLDKNSPINVFEIKPIRREFNYKLSAADVFNDFLYVGDDKGNQSTIKVTSTTTPSDPLTLRSLLSPHSSKSKISPNIALISCNATLPFHLSLYFLIRNFMLWTLP